MFGFCPLIEFHDCSRSVGFNEYSMIRSMNEYDHYIDYCFEPKIRNTIIVMLDFGYYIPESIYDYHGTI